MPDAQRFPLDFDALDKGSVISAETCTELFGVSPDSARYSGKQVDLCYRIERELENRGRNVTVICDHAEIRILEDSEASKHNQRRFKKRFKGARYNQRKMMEVDVGQLPPDERKEHDRAIVIQAAMLAGASAGKREAIALTYERKRPGLPKPETAEK